MEPRTPFEPDPEPLSPEAQAILRAYRDEHAPPPLVKARVRRRLDATGDPRRRMDAWVRAGVIAAAVILLLAALGALRPRAERGVVGRSRDAAEAAFVAASPEGRRAELGGRRGGAAGGSAGSADGHPAADTEAAESAVTAESAGSVGLAGAETAEAAGGERRRAKSRIAEAAETGEAAADSPGGAAETGEAAADSPADAAEAEAIPGTGAGDLAAEKRLLEKAWRALAAGDDAGALAAIDRSRREHPQGLLTQERAALEVITRCRASPGDPAARARVDAFAAAHPRSPWRGRIDAACSPARAP